MSIVMLAKQFTNYTVPTTAAVLQFRGMTNPRASNQTRARALRNLRLRAEMTQEVLAGKLNLTKQSLSAWETGRARPTAENIGNFLRHIGFTQNDLDAETSRIEDDVDEPAEALPAPVTQGLGEGLMKLEVPDENMYPWAAQGEWVYYEPGRRPRRGDGCVIELKNGQQLVRIYEKSTESHIFLTVVGLDKTDTYLYSDLRGFHRIKFRGD